MCGFDLEMFLSNFCSLAQRFTKAPRLNVNSICNTFFGIQKLIKSISDIFLISETKIDDTSKVTKVLGKTEMPLEDDFPFTTMNSLKNCLPNTFIEILSLNLRILNSKSLIIGTYKPPSQNKPTYTSEFLKITYILLLSL